MILSWIFWLIVTIFVARAIDKYPKIFIAIILIMALASFNLFFTIAAVLPDKTISLLLYSIPLFSAIVSIIVIRMQSRNLNTALYCGNFLRRWSILIISTWFFGGVIFFVFATITALDCFGKKLPMNTWLSNPQMWLLDFPLSIYAPCYWTVFALLIVGLIRSFFPPTAR